MRRGNLLALGIAAALAVSACGGGDDSGNGGSARPSDDGDAGVEGLATIHTVAELEPMVQGLVDAYNETSDAPVEVAVEDPAQAIEAVRQGSPGILPAPFLGDVDVESTAIGRTLAIIAVPAGNPSEVSGLDAFAEDSGLDTAVCGPESPYGNLAAALLSRADVELAPGQVGSGCEADAVARVERSELAAALVFRHLVQLPPDVEVVDIPEDQNIVLDVQYLPVSAAPSSGSFEEFLASDTAAQVLSGFGFLP
jgi:molybdate transport system substrate-binding protein